jgi:hypothetical protein
MRDLYKSIEYVERALARGLERKTTPPKKKLKPSYAWRSPVTVTDTQYPEQLFKPKEKPMSQLIVNARTIKVTLPLDAAAVAILPAPDGQPRSKLIISCEGRNYTADVAAKSLRKVKATIVANGVENVFVMVQGKLKNNEIIEAGIVAQLKVPKTADSSPKGEEVKT